MRRVGSVSIDVPVFWNRNSGSRKWKNLVDNGDNNEGGTEEKTVAEREGISRGAPAS